MTDDHKSWISPLVAITFLAVAVTGLLMAIHLQVPGVHALHLWSGGIFALVGAVHLGLNWRTFAAYFKKGPVLWTTAAGVLVLVLVAFAAPSMKPATGRHGAGGGHHGHAARSHW